MQRTFQQLNVLPAPAPNQALSRLNLQAQSNAFQDTPRQVQHAAQVALDAAQLAGSPSTGTDTGYSSPETAAGPSELDVDPGAFARICSHSDLGLALVSEAKALSSSRGY